jgi:hypothetical protein
MTLNFGAGGNRCRRSGRSGAQTSSYLFHRDLRDLQIRIPMIPLRGNVVEDQAERLALPGRERRQVEVHGFLVRTARA